MKTIKFIAKVIVAAIVAMGVALGVDALGIGYEYGFIAVFVCTAIGVALLLGAFDVREESKHESIKHYDGRRNYGQAAVFIGTACLFMGTPEQCEDMADDLWHWGQQAEVRALTENDVDFAVL